MAKISQQFNVKSITHFQCREWVLKKHYARRMPPIEFAFGLFCDSVLSAICTFGTPPSSTICAVFKPLKLLELNRLCANDGLPRNALSFLVSQSLNSLPKPCVVVSYADTSQNHVGYIYQATNFIYTGLSEKRTDWKIEGMEHLHSVSISDIARGAENRAVFLREMFGEKFYSQERPRKHRYFYFVGSKTQKKKMLNVLPYRAQQYPKGEVKKYDASFVISPQLEMF